ncbi:formimidoylglutamase [Alteromonas sp. H39]|uniref:formimidoylglutamase n=1 Tax=Alteromonas sp. H39 TaxID=3389876 RepID=UPI0039E126B7
MSHSALWTGRTDSEDGTAGFRWHQVVRPSSAVHDISKGDTVILGYPNDSGVLANKGRVGAAGGPNVLRQAMANLPWQLTGQLWDKGDSDVADSLDETQSNFASQVSELLQRGTTVLGLGGGHDIAWASWQGLHHAAPAKRIGIINLDAHLDLRCCTEVTSSGTPFRQIAEYSIARNIPFHYCCLGVSEASNTQALFSYAEKSGTTVLPDYAFTETAALASISPMLGNIDSLYVTICMDAFPASAAPGVSAPAAIGIEPAAVIRFFRKLSEVVREHNIDWALSDIAELNPTYDQSGKTARLAARMAFELTLAMQGSQHRV